MFHILSLNDQTAANMITVHFLFYSGCFRLSEVTCSCSSCVQFRCLDQRWRSFITLCRSHTELPLSDLSCVECFVFGLSDFIKCDTQFLWKLLNPRFGPNSSSSSCSDSVDVISIKLKRAELTCLYTSPCCCPMIISSSEVKGRLSSSSLFVTQFICFLQFLLTNVRTSQTGDTRQAELSRIVWI